MSRAFRYGLTAKSNRLSTPKYQCAENILATYTRIGQLCTTDFKCPESTPEALRRCSSKSITATGLSRWSSCNARPRARRCSIDVKSHCFLQRRRFTGDAPINGAALARWRTQTIGVPVGGNGSVELDLRRLSNLRPDASRTAPEVNDILLYLPPGPLVQQLSNGDSVQDLATQGEAEYEGFLNYLASLNSEEPQPNRTIVIRVNYRLRGLSSFEMPPLDHRFPSPIHDVSVAFEWILRNQGYLRSHVNEELRTDGGDFENEEPNSRILVYGSHIGGSLALMLALTQPNDIHAVVTHDPMVDWVGLDEAAELSRMPVASKRRSKTNLETLRLGTGQAATALIGLRAKLFRTPSGFFDPFASPLMFLRAPGRDTPLWRTARPEDETASVNEDKMVEEMKREGGVEVDKQETEELISNRGYGPYDDDWHTADRGLSDNVGEPSKTDSLSQTDHRAAEWKQLSEGLSSIKLEDNANADGATNRHANLVSSIPATAQKQQDLSLTVDIRSSPFSSPEGFSELGSVMKAVQARRRKVLRRWPPIGRPEEVDLPWTRILSRPPPAAGADPGPAGPTDHKSDAPHVADLSYVLHPQAKEMADVMRRACFWGRDKSLGEERVQLEILAGDASAAEIKTRGEGEYEAPRSVVLKAVDWFREIREVHK